MAGPLALSGKHGAGRHATTIHHSQLSVRGFGGKQGTSLRFGDHNTNSNVEDREMKIVPNLRMQLHS